MADFRRVTDHFYVAPQVDADDLRTAAAQGFRTVINNRPDGEAPGQLPSRVAHQVAVEAGMDYFEAPVSGAPTAAAIEAMGAILASAGQPVLAYCRSGTRSITLWALASARAGRHGPAEIVALAAAAGYDLSAHRGLLEDLAAR